MSKSLIFCLFCSGTLPLQAQYADLLKNQNISWVAEYTADFNLNPASCSWTLNSFINDLTVTQLSAAPITNGLYRAQHLESYFSQIIVDAIQEGLFGAYEDENLEIPVPNEKILERFSSVDTVTTFDPETYEEKTLIVRNELNSKDLVAFRVRQVFYYDKSEKAFGSRLLAIAPLVQKFDNEGNFFDSFETVVWLKMPELPKNWDKVEPKDFTYAVETKMKSNAPRQNDFKPKKGRIDFLTLIVNEVANPSHPVFDDSFKLIDPAKLQGFVISTDTVITYNPETFEEQFQIVQRNLLKDLEQIGFVQQWFFDSRKRLMFNRVTAIAPMVGMKDPEGNFKFSKPLFFLLNK